MPECRPIFGKEHLAASPAVDPDQTGSAPVGFNRLKIYLAHPIIPETGTGQSRCIVPQGPLVWLPVFIGPGETGPGFPPSDFFGKLRLCCRSSAAVPPPSQPTVTVSSILSVFSILLPSRSVLSLLKIHPIKNRWVQSNGPVPG